MTIKEKNVGNQGLEKRRAVVGPAKDCTVGTAAEEPVQLYFAQISCPTKPFAQNHAIFSLKRNIRGGVGRGSGIHRKFSELGNGKIS